MELVGPGVDGRGGAPTGRRIGAALWVGLVLAAAVAGAEAPFTTASQARPSGGVQLAAPVRFIARDTSITCFEGPLERLYNPGCFILDTPPTTGDCISHATQYFIQYIVPEFPTPHRIRGLAFISNDGATTFPSAGVVLIPSSQNRFPTPAELAGLQVRNVPTPHDTAIVVVDLTAFNLVVNAGTDIVVCLQFPEGGRLTDVGVGPGIVMDETAPDQNCDFMTVNSGTGWALPVGDPPLDWGFEVIFERVLAIEGAAWSEVKRFYGGERLFPYRSP